MSFCRCKQCKKARRKGKILGTRRMMLWLRMGHSGKPELYDGPVSDYVPYHRWQKGRGRKERNDPYRDARI